MPVIDHQRGAVRLLLVLAAVVGGCLLGGYLLIGALLSAGSAESDARDRLLKVEAQEIIRGLESQNPAPGDLGEALVSRVTSHFGVYGEAILRQEVAPGVPADGETAGEIDVRVVRTGQGTALGQPTGPESFTMCVRFRTQWSRDGGIVTTVREIGCP
ncbi:hypothetical protein [Actinoplanes sp. NPDC049802]|uniref:hypothetical protein n=1 Tax=Actinoplanes sp. NPDC049802 TaxID=3154742 RepID=UPI00340ED20B